MIVSRTQSGNVNDILKMKSFVYRTSRFIGGAVGPPAGGIIV
jgi:hypothetical protein